MRTNHAYYAGTVQTELTEIVTTSITASGGRSGRYEDIDGRRDENPSLQYFDNRYRGYTLLELRPDQVEVTRRVVGDFEVEDSPVSTLARMFIDDSRIGVRLA
jgi:phosphodiesterase/alkaline phosphatase D-like protein